MFLNYIYHPFFPKNYHSSLKCSFACALFFNNVHFACPPAGVIKDHLNIERAFMPPLSNVITIPEDTTTGNTILLCDRIFLKTN